jgi:hypothetical protein
LSIVISLGPLAEIAIKLEQFYSIHY